MDGQQVLALPQLLRHLERCNWQTLHRQKAEKSREEAVEVLEAAAVVHPQPRQRHRQRPRSSLQ
jgi:hypothetical protein